MEQFINSIGKNNLMVILAIVLAIVLALIIIMIIEKIQSRKRSYRNYNYEEIDEKDSNDVIEKTKILYEEPATENTISDNLETEPIIYKEEDNSEIAKKKLNDAAQKLVEIDEPVTDKPTHFEVEQEEKSIISYEELKSASKEIDELNDVLLEEEESYPITIEELYQKHVEDQESVVALENPLFDDDLPKKFKNSDVISPVFGVYGDKDKSIVYDNSTYEKKMSKREIEQEIQKTEDFLLELRNLKNKLN